MSGGEVRGGNEFKEMWLIDTLDIDLDAEGVYLGDETAPGSVLYQLAQAKAAQNGILLDTTSNGDAPLMAGAYIKHEGNGDPANTGKERAKVTLEAKIDGLQKTTDMDTLKKIIGFNGKIKNIYHIDRRLGIVEKAVDQNLKVVGDGTNNQAYVTTITGEEVGTLSEIYQRRTIAKLLPPELLLPLNNTTSTGPDNPRNITFTWGDALGAEDYEFEIIKESEDPSRELTAGAKSVIKSLQGAEDPLYVSYLWRVRSKRGSIYSQWSEQRTLRVQYSAL